METNYFFNRDELVTKNVPTDKLGIFSLAQFGLSGVLVNLPGLSFVVAGKNYDTCHLNDIIPVEKDIKKLTGWTFPSYDVLMAMDLFRFEINQELQSTHQELLYAPSYAGINENISDLAYFSDMNFRRIYAFFDGVTNARDIHYWLEREITIRPVLIL